MFDVLALASRLGGRVRQCCTALTGDESGATAIEYGLLLAGLSLLILVAVFELGDALDGMFNHVRTTFTEANAS